MKKINKDIQYFINKYPKMLTLEEDGRFSVCVGFEPVWLDLIDELMDCIQSYIDNNKHLNISQVRIHQIKEKFGNLRFYYDGGDETIHGMVWFAEYQSQFICEKCGKPAELKETHGWYRTICKECKEKEDEKKRK